MNTPHETLGSAFSKGMQTLGTFPQATDRRNASMITMATVLACVINGDTLSGVLRQATWLVVTVVVLIVARTVEARLSRGPR